MLQPRSEDRERFDLWAMDTSTGQLRMLVDSTKIGGGEISEAEKMRRERARVGGSKGIVEYEWAPDGKSCSRRSTATYILRTSLLARFGA